MKYSKSEKQLHRKCKFFQQDQNQLWEFYITNHVLCVKWNMQTKFNDHQEKEKGTSVEINCITYFAANACRSILGISFTVAFFRALFTATIYTGKIIIRNKY